MPAAALGTDAAAIALPTLPLESRLTLAPTVEVGSVASDLGRGASTISGGWSVDEPTAHSNNAADWLSLSLNSTVAILVGGALTGERCALLSCLTPRRTVLEC